MKRILCILTILIAGYLQSEEYHFAGVHYMASYRGCDHSALADIERLQVVMKNAVTECGATLLNTSEYAFSPEAITMVLLLSESHASIHTYPEFDACYVDLFTCGNKCDYTKFEQVLKDYLKPDELETRILKR